MKLDTVTGLRYRHERGQKLLDKFPVGGGELGEAWPERPKYQLSGVFEALAKEQGITLQELHLRRRFAFLYWTEDLERLCRYDPPLSWSTIKWLLRVEDRDERNALEQAAAKNGWTAAELKAERRRRKGTSHAGGRPPKLPSNFPGGLEATLDTIRRLQLLLSHVLIGERALAKHHVRASKKRQELEIAARSALSAIEALHERIQGERSLKRIKKGPRNRASSTARRSDAR